MPTECYAAWDLLLTQQETPRFSASFMHDVELEPATIDRALQHFSELVRLQRRHRLGVKITGPSRIGVLAQLFPDAVFIRVHRHLIPTLASFSKVNFAAEKWKQDFWWEGPYTDTEKEAILTESNPVVRLTMQLRKIDEVTRLEVERYAVDVIDVHYESFVENKMDTVEALLEQCGLAKQSSTVLERLASTEVHARNKPDDSYFTEQELAGIKQAYGAD